MEFSSFSPNSVAAGAAMLYYIEDDATMPSDLPYMVIQSSVFELFLFF